MLKCFTRQAQGWNVYWADVKPCHAQVEKAGTTQMLWQQLMILSKDSMSLLVRITTWVWIIWIKCGVLFSRRIYFHDVLAHLWFHISQQSLYHTQFHPPGLQSHPQAAQWAGLCVQCPPWSKVNKGHITHLSGLMEFIMASCLRELQWGWIYHRNLC